MTLLLAGLIEGERQTNGLILKRGVFTARPPLPAGFEEGRTTENFSSAAASTITLNIIEGIVVSKKAEPSSIK